MTIFSTEPPPPATAPMPAEQHAPRRFHDGSVEPHSYLRRPLWSTVRRHRVLLMAVLSLLVSLVFWVAPRMGRAYELSGSMTITMRPYEPMPALSQLPAAALNAFHGNSPNVRTSLTGSGNEFTLKLSDSASARHIAYMQLHSFAEDFGTFLRRQVEDTLFDYRSRLGKEQDRLAGREDELTRSLETFRGTHPGILPDDPNSVVAQYDKISNRLDDKQQRLRLVSDHLTRLREYKHTIATKGPQSIAPPPAPLPPPSPEVSPNAGGKPDNDPEVMALTAQLTLVNDQIEEQLRTRTEQHPYVVDLRNQQSNLQKKLDAAKQRAASGAPAPATVHPLAPAPVSADPSLAAAQQVDLQIESLESENDTLKLEIGALTQQRDAMKGLVDQVMPARRELDRLAGQLDAVKKDRQTVASQVEQFDRRFAKSGQPAMPGTISLNESLVEVSPLALVSNSTLPTFPRLPLIYGGGLLLGILAATGVAKLLHRMDHTFHHPQEVAAMLGMPLLGTVSEIRAPRVRHWRGIWKTMLRPMVMAGMALVMLASAVQCYRHLADPGFATGSKFVAAALDADGLPVADVSAGSR